MLYTPYGGYSHTATACTFVKPSLYHPPKVDPGLQESLVITDRDGRPRRGSLEVHCFSVCNSSSALLGYLLGVSWSVEYDLLSVLSIIVRFFLDCVH